MALVLAVASPLLAFLGVLAGQWVARRGAREMGVRWRREETMRMLRWSVDLATSTDPSTSGLGVVALFGLQESEILRAADQELISRILAAIVSPVESRYSGGDEIVLEEEA